MVVQSVAERLTLWFRNNCMKVNPDKFHLLLRDKKSHQVDICNENLSSTCSEKFLGIKNDNKLTFEERVEGLCKKASQKKSVLWQKFCFKRNLNKEIVSLIDS